MDTDTIFETILVCKHPYENKWAIVGVFNDGSMHVVREGKNKRDLVDHAKSLDEQLDTFEYIYSLTEEEADNVEQIEEN